MDNLQTHIFTASRRLNDLTGYSGIEALKNDIEAQESLVQRCRQAVKSSREEYTEAIAKRSTTQREVNDLLHRKHTWSPVDLERFTSLYRSDHANEQTEAAAQKKVADAEQSYEEASTKLAKAILARYHEEQIWSDKIRQMSTWGTWGLMGINVLLFLIFQVVLEPWRRRRLVKGFEEKVELAIKEGQQQAPITAVAVQPNQTSKQAVEEMTAGERVEAVADNIAGQIVDAITGTAADEPTVPLQAGIEEAAEVVAATEIAVEEGLLPDTSDIALVQANESRQENPNPTTSSRWTSSTSSLASYEDYIRSLFSDDHRILVSQRELTTVAMEGVAGGMAIMGLLFVLLRPR
jgi:sensitive to high expression protein 9, mitochondrial